MLGWVDLLCFPSENITCRIDARSNKIKQQTLNRGRQNNKWLQVVKWELVNPREQQQPLVS